MKAEASRKRLGRGLSALLGDVPAGVPEAANAPASAPARDGLQMPIEMLHAGAFQPRRRFDDTEMAALVDSIKAHGVLQPILVRPDPARPGHFEIVAGERRWRASQAAGLTEVPVSVRALADRDALEIALIENLQREGLTAIEEAAGYRRLQAEFGHTQEALAQAIGKSRSHVANMLRLLDLPDEVKALVDAGKLSAGHARALIGSADPAALAREVVRKGLNVRQTEAFAARAKLPQRKRGPRAKDADTAALERDLSELLGLKVMISFQGTGGVLSIHYANLEQLDDVLHRLNLGSRKAQDTDDAAEQEFFADEEDAGDVGAPKSKTAPPELPSFLRRK